MDLSVIKPVIALSSSSFYRKIMQKYQTGKKKTSSFLTMFFYKGNGSFFPQKISMFLRFNLYINQQNILPLVILKNVFDVEGRLSRLKTEKKNLQSMIKLRCSQSTNYVTELFLTAFKNPQEYSVALERLLAGNIENKLNKDLTLSFLPVSSNSYQQKVRNIYSKNNLSNRIIQYPEILNYESSMEILNSKIFEKDLQYELFNNPRKLIFIDNENEHKYLADSECKLLSNYLKTQNLLSFLTLKNIQAIKEIFSWVNTEKNCLQSILGKKGVLNVNDAANMYISQMASKTPQEPQSRPEFLLTENVSTSKISVFSLFKSLVFKAGNIIINSNKALNSSLLPVNHAFYHRKISTNFPDVLAFDPRVCCVHKLLINSKKDSMFTAFRKYFEMIWTFPFSTTRTRDSFLKCLVFKAGDIVINSNKGLKLLHLSESDIYYPKTNNSIYSGISQTTSEILNHKNDEKVSHLQVFKAQKIYRSLNITRHSSLTNRKSIVKNQLTSEDEFPSIFFQGNLLSAKIYGTNGRLLKESKRVTINKPYINNYYGNFKHEIPGCIPSKYDYNMRHENLVFQDRGRIEQELEHIKKTIIETRKSMSEKKEPVFGEPDFKKYFDINQISSQVYQNIERTIRLERERRGV